MSHKFDPGLVLAVALSLFIIQSLLQPGLPTLADLPIHLYRTLEYGQAWGPGVIVPRWAPNLAYGYGYPLYVFAPPLPYWLGLAFQGLGFSLENAFKLLIIFTILLYAIGMYLLGRDVWGSVEAGLVAATAYAFAPFALRETLLYGGNIPQLLAIGLFPWTLWAMTRAARTRSWGWAITAACFFAAILLSHLFHALIFTPIAGVYGLIQFSQSGVMGPESGSKPQGVREWLKNLVFAIRHSSPGAIVTGSKLFMMPSLPSPFALATIPLGLLLAAFFWLPAFTERVFTRAQADIYLVKSPFYVRYPYWSELTAWIPPLDARAANPYVPLTLGVATLGLAVLGLLTVAREWRLGLKPHPQLSRLPSSPPSTDHRLLSTLFFAATAISGIFLTLPISRPVWELVSILQVAEFPWRMLGLANLGLAFLAGGAVVWLPAKLRWPLTGLCLLLQLGAVAPLLYPMVGFTRYEPISLANQVDYERRSQSIGTTTLGEYLPQTVTKPPTTSPLIDPFLAGQIPERLDRASLPARASATLLEQTAVTHIYRFDSPSPFTARLFQFDYPGWQAQLNDQPIPIQPEPETGLILINIPAGQNTLTVHFGETPGRIFALILTGLTLAGLLGAGVAKKIMINSQRSMVNSHWKNGEDSPAPLPRRFPTLLSIGLIIAAAFWLKPLLRPVFTLNSPPGQALPAQQSTRIDFVNGIQLLGYDLDRQVVQAGERVEVVLYWQTETAPLKSNLQPFVHLDRLDTLTTVADATNYTPGDATTESVMPTFHWDNARYVRDEHDLIVPATTPPLAYALRVGLIDPDREGRLVRLADGSGDTAQLAIINVAPAQPSAPPLAEPIQASFQAGSATIELTGFEISAISLDQLDFKLAWRATSTPPANYTVFTQLLDLQHNLAASFDQPPLAGAYPTSTWLAGQTIIDPRIIPLRGVAAGEYHLIVGLYDPVTQQRLLTGSGADFIELSRVKIGAE